MSNFGPNEKSINVEIDFLVGVRVSVGTGFTGTTSELFGIEFTEQAALSYGKTYPDLVSYRLVARNRI